MKKMGAIKKAKKSGYDQALTRYNKRGNAVYNGPKLKALCMADGMTEEEAVQFIDYNYVGFGSVVTGSWTDYEPDEL